MKALMLFLPGDSPIPSSEYQAVSTEACSSSPQQPEPSKATKAAECLNLYLAVRIRDLVRDGVVRVSSIYSRCSLAVRYP